MHPDIQKLSAFRDNWDGYDGVPMSPQTLKNADALLRALAERYNVRATPMSNGTVMLEWVWAGAEYTLEVGATEIASVVDKREAC